MNNEEIFRNTRKQFFAYRNGIIADSLRKNGDPHSMIMGCQMTDVAQIATGIEPSKEIAEAFWADTKHRECRMIAPMLYPAADMDKATALEWAKNVECEEIADVLCHRLLRKLPFAAEIAMVLKNSAEPMAIYTGFRLLLNSVLMNKVEKTDSLKAELEKEKENAPQKAQPISASILEEFEVDF